MNTAVGKMGYYLPFGVTSSILGAVGSGLLTTLNPSTTTGEWIGYQIIAGVNRGMSMQIVRPIEQPFFGFPNRSIK